MGTNLLFGSAVYLLIFVNAVISGRFPSGINRVGYGDVYENAVGVIRPRLLDWGDDENEDNSVEDSNSREVIASLEDYLNGDEGNTPYITDVQINELQNAQDKPRQDQEVYQVDPRCPKFNGLCSAQICNSDRDCGGRICCYNGCVHTCVDNQGPPIEVDWITFGTQDKVSLIQSDISDEKTITIPGGCKVSKKQKSSLELFYKYGHVTKSVCMKDDVVCYVRKREIFSTPNSILSFSSEATTGEKKVKEEAEASGS